MKKGIALVVAMVVGSAFGAAVRGTLSEAHAQSPARLEYRVVGASALTSGYEEDLNKAAAEGFHFAGSIPSAKFNGMLVLERSR